MRQRSAAAAVALAMACSCALVAAAGPYYLTGTIRDRPRTGFTDFGVAVTSGNADSGGSSWFQSSSSVLGDPVASGTTTANIQNFANWWADDNPTTGIAPYTIRLTENPAKLNFFKFESADPFYPIDNLLLGNGGDPNNRYFSYELHSMFTYTGNAATDGMEFNSRDDLYVFLNGKFCALSTSLTGLHDKLGSPATLSPAVCNAATGNTMSASNQYRIDIFWASRSSVNAPYLYMQLPTLQNCNAATTNIIDSTLFPYTAANTIVSGISQITSATAIRLSASGQLNFNGAVYNSIKKRVSNGFVSTFTFQVTPTNGSPLTTPVAEGFAFVLQSTSTSSRGSGGQFLGYNFQGSLAIEFDMNDNGAGDPNYNHIELHTAYDLAVDNAPDNYVITSTAPVLSSPPAITMADGAAHNVIVQYTPCLPACQIAGSPGQPQPCGTCAQPAGYMSVWIDGNLRLYSKVNDDKIKAMMSSGSGLAYVGFTVGTSSIAANIDITNWRFYNTPVSALLSVPVETVSPFGTGTCTGACTATASNAMLPSPFYIRAADACGTPIPVGGDSVTVSWPAGALTTTGLTAVADQGNGRYAVQYAQQTSGSIPFSVLLNSQVIAASPLTMTISPAIVSAATSTWPGTIPQLTAGAPVSLAVTAKDQFGNAVTATNAPISVQMTSGSNSLTMPAPTVVGNVFTFQVSFNYAGSAQLYVRANNIELAGSPFTATVVAAAAQGAGSFLANLGGQTLAGNAASIVLYPCDAFGNAVQVSSGQTIVFTMTLATNAAITGTTSFAFVPQSAGQNAYWNLTKKATIAGSYIISVKLNNVEVQGTTANSNPSFFDSVLPTFASAATTTTTALQVPAAPSVTAYAGVLNYFYINTFDQYGNALISPNNGFSVQITPPAGAGGAQTVQCDGVINNNSPFAQFSCAYDTNSAGRYVVNFQCLTASTGLYTYVVSLNAVPLSSGARTFTCKPGNVDASQTRVTFTPTGFAGGNTFFLITLRDAYGNIRSAGDPANFPDDNKLAVSITSPSGAAVGLAANSLVNNNNGSFTQTYTSTQAGINQLRVLLTGAPIYDGNTVPQTILAGGTYAPATQFSGVGYQNGGLSGATGVVYTLVAYDMFGNPRLTGGDTWTGSVAPNDGSAAVPYSSAPVGGSPGTYTVTYTIPTASASVTAYNLTTTLTTAGNVFAGRVTLVISTGLEMFAQFSSDPRAYTVSPGVMTPVTITRMDKFGVLTPNLATTFSFDFSTGGPNPGDVTSCVLPPSAEAFVSPTTPGAANIAFKCKKAGTYLLNMRGNGEFVNTTSPGFNRIGKAPFVVTVSAGLAQDVIVYGLGGSIIAGASTSITIQLVDAYGNNVTSTPAGLQLRFTNQGNQAVDTPVNGPDVFCPAPTQAANGQYKVTFSSRVKGLKTLSFLLGGTPLPGVVPASGSPVSPTKQFTVLPDVPDQTKTQLNFKLVTDPDPANIPTATAGQPVDFYLSLFDQFNNVILEFSPGVPMAFVVALQDNPAPGLITGVAGQYFSMRVTPTIVKVTDSAVYPTFAISTSAGQGSRQLWSKSMFIAPAAISAAQTTVNSLPTAILPFPISLGNAIAGVPIVFNFVAKDQYGNGLPNNSPTLTFRCKVNARSLIDASVPFTELTLNPPTVAGQATVTQATQGVFTFTFTPTRTGVYYFKFFAVQSVGGVPQLPVEVVPNSGVSDVSIVAAAAKSLSPPLFLTTTQWAAGIPQRYRLRLVDEFGNGLQYRGSSVTLQFLQYPVLCTAADVDVTSQFASPATSVIDNLDGSFNITILTTISGQFAMKLGINGGQYLPCSAPAGQDTISNRFAFITTPGPFDAAHSRIFAIVPSGRAGSTFTLRIASSDRFDNAVVINPPNPIVRLEPYRGWCAGSATSWLAAPSTVTTPVLTITPRQGLASFLDISFSPSKAGTAMYFNVTINGTQVGTAVTPDGTQNPPLLGALCPSLAVGSADTAVITAPPETNVVAAIPTSYTAQGFDQFTNPVIRNDHTFLATYRSVNISYQFVVESTATNPGLTPDQLVAYTPVWAGDYEVELIVSDARGLSGVLLKRAVNVRAATCGGQTGNALPYRCPGTTTCVASYANCPPFTPSAPNVCPGGTVACPDFNYCVSNTIFCPKRQQDLCPAGKMFRCPSGDCRASADDCPTNPVCPPGYSFCPDNRQCAINMADCLLPAAGSCPTGQYRCQDGACVLRKEDCPTRKTCPVGQVLCTDGACAASVNQCYDQYLCYGDTPLRCPDGSCRSDLRDCPKAVTCPIGWVLCESGACAPALAQCTAAVRCSASQTRCPDGSCRPNLLLCPTPVSCPQSAVGAPALVRCHDGSCVASISQCTSPVLCSGAKPYTCADSSCVTDPKYCATPIRCPDVSPILCPDKSCAAAQAECMKSSYCLQVTPLTPYMCETGRCVATPDACGKDLQCPSTRPIRCSEGTCVANSDECPSGLSACPDNLPLRCPDGACAAASDQCSDNTKLTCPTQTLPNAPFSFVRCPSGHCATSRGACPTTVSCGPNLNRCRDGTCRSSCDQVTPNQCVGGQVTCPVSQHGPACAATLADCPNTVTCPRDRPIKCVDASCAASFADCPSVSAYSANKVACAGGTWAPTLATCGTQVSCPKSLPAKCWDESCRLTAADCPPRPKCPSTAPFACSDGSCYATLSDCRASVQCNPAQSQAFRGTVKCPFYDSNLGSSSAGCVKSAADCDKYNPLTFAFTKSQSPDQNLGTQVRCPNLAKRCRDGSCRSDATQCATLTCPPHVPYRCPDGLCARRVQECRNATNACPFDAPAKCADGSCALDAAACKVYESSLVLGTSACANGTVTCEDGSCVRSITSCPLPTGCTTGFEACNDRNCVQIPTGAGVNSLCVDSSGSSGNNDAYNQCPVSRPYQCPDGYCALSSRFCPIYPADDGVCSVTTAPNGLLIVKPYRCADGTCVFNLAQCAPLAPCRDASTRRCLDGTCRIGSSADVNRVQADSCPKVNTCPPNRPFRCEHSGLCAVNQASCIDDPLEFAALRTTKQLNASQALSVFGGCPQSRIRCPGGYCASATQGCAADVAPTKWVSQAWNGCPAGSYGAINGKCPNGECSPLNGICKLPNGCDPTTPFLCGDGVCSATVCNPAAAACTQVTCGDGKCVASQSQCTSKWQCPLNAPYRCADGTCKRYPAIVNEHTLWPNAALSCKAVVVCENPNPYLCADGSCATEAANCRPLMPCNLQSALNPEFPNLCTNLRCGSANSTCTNYANTCPPANPVLCPNGACRRSAAECSWNSLSAADAKCTDPNNQVMCFDGFCRASSLKCIEWQFAATQGAGWNPNAVVTNSTCNKDDVLCTTNGACQPAGTYCPPVPACPANLPLRCPDGSCRNSTINGECATMDSCGTGLVRCEDGTCNERDSCPTFDGCPITRPYYCAGLESPCVADAAACETGYAANGGKPQACDTGCMRDLRVRGPLAYPVPQEGDLNIDIAVDANHVPRATVTVPAGAVHISAGLITVAPVPLAAFAGVIVALDENRAPEFGTSRFLSMTALKSAPFTLLATGAELDTTYGVAGANAHASQLGITVTAYIDPLLYQVTTAQAAAAAAASAVQIPCAYQASFTVERVLISQNSAGQDIAIACTGTSDVAKDAVTLTMDTCDGSAYTGFVVSATEIEQYSATHQEGSACVCYNLTRSTPPPPALNIAGYAVGQMVCTLFQRQVDTIKSATFVNPYDAMFNCPTSIPASESGDTTIRSLIYTAKSTSPCQNAATGDAARFIPANDICLARVRKPPMPQEGRAQGYGDAWACLYGRDDRIANPVWSTAANGQAATQYKATIPPSEIAVSGEYAYAFVHSPLPPPPAAERESQSAWEAYGKIILIVIICVGVFALIASYVTWRLIRYRRKYKENQKKKIELTDRRNNLEEFSGGLGIADEEVDMVANPMVIELQNLEMQIKKVNEEMGVQEQRDAQAINRLEEDRKKLYAEIDRVKQAMAKAEAEAEAAAKITAARETAAAQARANAANADAFGTSMAGTSVRPGGGALSGAAVEEGDNFGSAARPSQVHVAVDAGSGTTATTTAKGTTRLDFGQAKIRRPRDLSNA